jgi:hypothetical protein
MTYAELSEAQARRSRQFAEAQTEVMSVYCDAERDLKDLQAENDRLREVVKSMYYDLTNMTFPPDWVTDYAADMRELGIETGDGVS